MLRADERIRLYQPGNAAAALPRMPDLRGQRQREKHADERPERLYGQQGRGAGRGCVPFRQQPGAGGHYLRGVQTADCRQPRAGGPLPGAAGQDLLRPRRRADQQLCQRQRQAGRPEPPRGHFRRNTRIWGFPAGGHCEAQVCKAQAAAVLVSDHGGLCERGAAGLLLPPVFGRADSGQAGDRGAGPAILPDLRIGRGGRR